MPDDLTYDAVGSTRVGDATWDPASAPSGYRRYESTTPLGHGPELWEQATAALLRWGVKTRSGFSVLVPSPADLLVAAGQDRVLAAHLGPFVLREPVRVVDVVEDPDRCGFAYGTRPGHPVSGEEAFVLHRDPEGQVFLTLRSLTRPGRGWWRLLYPVALLAQPGYRARYRRALRAV